jgi:hypothetical protein
VNAHVSQPTEVQSAAPTKRRAEGSHSAEQRKRSLKTAKPPCQANVTSPIAIPSLPLLSPLSTNSSPMAGSHSPPSAHTPGGSSVTDFPPYSYQLSPSGIPEYNRQPFNPTPTPPTLLYPAAHPFRTSQPESQGFVQPQPHSPSSVTSPTWAINTHPHVSSTSRMDVGAGSMAPFDAVSLEACPNHVATQFLPQINHGCTPAPEESRSGMIPSPVHSHSGSTLQQLPTPLESTHAPLADRNGAGPGPGPGPGSSASSEMAGDSDSSPWSGKLVWWCDDTPMEANVLTSDHIGNP